MGTFTPLESRFQRRIDLLFVGDSITDFWRTPGRGLSARPLADGQVRYTPDVTREPEYIPGLDSGSEVDVPVKAGSEVLGVLVVDVDAKDLVTEFCHAGCVRRTQVSGSKHRYGSGHPVPQSSKKKRLACGYILCGRTASR